MNRNLKEATVRRYYYTTHEQFRQHLEDFVRTDNFARLLKALKGHTLQVHLQYLTYGAQAL